MGARKRWAYATRVRAVSVIGAVVAASALPAREAAAQACRVGRACFYVPAGHPAPTDGSSVGWDLVLSSSRSTVTGTYRVGALGAATPFTVRPGAPMTIDLGTTPAARGIAAGFAVAEGNGVFVDASSEDLVVDHRELRGYWQSSSTIKSAARSLGTRFRLAGFGLNRTVGPQTGHDYASVYAPTGATVTFTAPPGEVAPYWDDGIMGLTHTVTLRAGETIMIRTLPGCRDAHGALVTATSPVSVESGGRGWAADTGACTVAGGCGDDGADHLVPVRAMGTQFVVDDFPSAASTGERVHVIAERDGTQVRVNGALVATLMAGQQHAFSPSGLAYIETTLPALVSHEASATGCELDTATIAPAIFAATGAWSLEFNNNAIGVLSVVIPRTAAATVSVRRGATTFSPTATTQVPTRADLARVLFTNLSSGDYQVGASAEFQAAFVTGAGGAGLYAYYAPFRVVGCGDGSRTSEEGCDDGNVVNGDGCSDVCRVESGSTVPCASPTDCAPTAICVAGRCVVRCAVNADCDDGDPCTIDRCDALASGCVNTAAARGTPCSDGSCGISLADGTQSCVVFTNDLDRDSIADNVDADDDNDGVPDAVEGSADPDGDMIPASRDLDSDGDGLTDMFETGSGALDVDGDGRVDVATDVDGDGLAAAFDSNDSDRLVITSRVTPRNSDAMVAASEGTADMIADFLDNDDDGDGVLTRDELGAGAMAAPANSDAAGSLPDFLDTDSDNDCVPDRDPRETGAARTDPAVPAAQPDLACSAGMRCDRSTGRCTITMQPDASTTDGSDASDASDGATNSDASDASDASNGMDASGSSPGVSYGGGACACRAPSAPRREHAPCGALFVAVSVALSVASRPRRRTAR